MTSRSPVSVGLILAGWVCCGIAGCQTSPSAAPAELVLRGGRIVTVDEKVPEAQGLAANEGKIIAIGSDADIAPYIGPSTRVIDLAGQLAIPGFIEGHGHFTGVGQNRINLDFMSATSWDESLPW